METATVTAAQLLRWFSARHRRTLDDLTSTRLDQSRDPPTPGNNHFLCETTGVQVQILWLLEGKSLAAQEFVLNMRHFVQSSDVPSDFNLTSFCLWFSLSEAEVGTPTCAIDS